MKWMSRLENIVLVTLITALVWLYAEGRAVRTDANRSIRIVFAAPVGQEGELAILPREPMEVQATVRGSSSQLAVFNGLVADGPLRIDVTRETRSPLRMADALEASALGEIGVNIDDVSPEEMPISVEAIVEATLPVKVQAEDVQLAPNPTVTPDHVTVRLPASKLEMAKELSAIASLRDVQLDQFTVGVPQKVDVTVQLPASLQTPWTQVTPQQASVTFTVRKINDVLTLDRVPVLLSVPPQLLTQWRFELDDRNRVLVGVEIAGPSDAIQAIRDHKLDVFAEVRPRTDDLKEGVAKLTAVVLAPPGVTVTSPAQTVDVKITPIEATPVTP